jgi:F-type H+-transporting ATPase subunit epsilon
MADNIEFELVSPERLLLSAPVEMVVVPGAEGDFGVLAGHAPMITGVRTGVIATYEDGRVDKRIFVAGGFAEVTPERCTVLAEEAVLLDAADRAATEARIKAAEDALADANNDDERAAAQAELDIAAALLSAITAVQTN